MVSDIDLQGHCMWVFFDPNAQWSSLPTHSIEPSVVSISVANHCIHISHEISLCHSRSRTKCSVQNKARHELHHPPDPILGSFEIRGCDIENYDHLKCASFLVSFSGLNSGHKI